MSTNIGVRRATYPDANAIIIESQEQYTIVHCLRVAADQFDRDAAVMTDAKQTGLVRTFKDQATHARALADAIENAE